MNERHLGYSMLIEWSEEDQAYLVTLPAWADRVITPATHVRTYFTHPLLHPRQQDAVSPLPRSAPR